jgi:SpoVK/Ycf46/Vps4 family AAA+-type ATPase
MGFELPSDPDERTLLTTTDMWTTPHPNDVPLPTEPPTMFRLALDFLKKARYSNPDDPFSGPEVPGGARSAALVVPRMDLFVPPCEKYLLSPERLRLVEMLEIASTDSSLEDAQNPIVLMTPSRSDIFSDVRKASGLRQIRVPLPGYPERLQFIYDLIDMKPWLTMAISAEDFAVLTAGQNCRDIEDITLRAGDRPLTRRIVLERGGELIDARYGGVMQRLNPTFGFDGIGGNVGLKDFLQRKVISRIRRGITKGVPMGMLLAGPPGVGKSALAMAAAFEAGINAIEIRNLKDKWLGNSEKNLEEMIEGRDVRPTFLFMDE